MPWKLLFYLILLGIILAFVGLNLGNTTDISLGFVTFEDVPVFMSLFAAFFVGVAVTVPAVMQSSSRKTRARTEKRADRRRQREERKAAKEAARAGKVRRKALKAGEGDLSHSSGNSSSTAPERPTNE